MIGRSELEQIRAAALAAGFVRCGIAAVPEPGSPAETRQRERFESWLEHNFHGEMAWLARSGADGVPLRSSLTHAAPWARSVVLCAASYNFAAPPSTAPAPVDAGWIARYAMAGIRDAEQQMQPADYHQVLLQRLESVQRAILQLAPEARTHAYVDTGPVVERHLAQMAGLGWIGKNTCLMNQQDGSWLLLATVLTSLELSADAVLEMPADRCGSCTRCIDACPTDALVAPHVMDARRCISYLTIEKKGSIDADLRAGMGRQVFGCDICQDVCPWNRRAPVDVDADMHARPELINPPLDWLAAMDAAQFHRVFAGSPLERTGLKRVRRNVAIAMGNTLEQRWLPQLELWAASEDAVLQEASIWAAQQIRAAALLASDAPKERASLRDDVHDVHS